MKIKKIAVLTSGGDAPGMNAAIRAIVRAGISHQMEVFGVKNGFQGLIDNDIIPLGARDVGGILQLGGTTLRSARSLEFKTEDGQEMAINHLKEKNIDGLVVIGGNGTQTGSYYLSQKGIPVIGLSSTIDNDLVGTDITIGVDTALNIALEAIDRLKVTASSHGRVMVVEVMGRDCGYLALMAGIAGGAELIIIPEVEQKIENIIEIIERSYQKGKKHCLIVTAEGSSFPAHKLEEFFKFSPDPQYKKIDLRATILGHVQRGGTPTLSDRILATRFGVAAIEAFCRGEKNLLIGLKNNQICQTPLHEIKGKTKAPDISLLELNQMMGL